MMITKLKFWPGWPTPRLRSGDAIDGMVLNLPKGWFLLVVDGDYND